jgi:hypothetical protein
MNLTNLATVIALVLPTVACSSPADGDDSKNDAKHEVVDATEQSSTEPPSSHGAAGMPTPPTSEQGPSAPPVPRWLASSWTRSYDDGYDFSTERYSLRQDGSGEHYRSTISPYVPYGAADTVSTRAIQWSASASTLSLNGIAAPFVASPNCRILKIRNDVFLGSPSVGCPFSIAPLASNEAALVGTWRFFRAAVNGWSSAWLSLSFSSDRYMHFSFQEPTSFTQSDKPEVKIDTTFSLDTTGTLHSVDIDGDEQAKNITLTVAGRTLTWCDPSGCLDLPKQ